jgi:hypothetical protein
VSGANNTIALVPSTTVSANGTSTPVDGLSRLRDLFGGWEVSAVPTGGAPTLDVYLQTTFDGGTTWQDIAHYQFTTSAVKRLFSICGSVAGPTTSVAPSDAALSGDTVVQGPWGDKLRAKWVFAAGGSTGSYTLAGFVVGKTGT